MSTSSLAAILFTELSGFGDYLSQSEEGALDLLSRWRGLAEPLIAAQGGDLVDATGDELLVVFSSAVAAVRCAVALREATGQGLRARDGLVLQPRTGIHLGEIWRDEARVYGNGVNVAARIKAAAGPGQILVSEDIHRQVETKLGLESRAVANHGLKNIQRSLGIFEVAPLAPGSLPPSPRLAPPASPPPPASLPPPPSLDREASRRAIKAAILKGLAEKGNLKVTYTTEGRTLIIGGAEDEEDEVDDEDEDEDEAEDKATPAPAGYDAARMKVSKGLASFLGGGAIFAVCGYFYLRSPGFLWAVGAFLFGLGPCLSGLKNLVTGLFEQRDYRKDHPEG